MLHYAVLAWHEKHWGRFLSRLRFVVVDECHEYRGIFGTNVSVTSWIWVTDWNSEMARPMARLTRRIGAATLATTSII